MLVPSADLVVFFFPKKIIPLVAPFPFSSVLLIPSQGMKEGVQGSGLIPPELAAVKLSAGGAAVAFGRRPLHGRVCQGTRSFSFPSAVDQHAGRSEWFASQLKWRRWRWR